MDRLFLWFNDFYDGPLTGMAELNRIRYLFDMIDYHVLGAEEEERRYWLIAFTDEPSHPTLPTGRSLLTINASRARRLTRVVSRLKTQWRPQRRANASSW